MDDKTAEANEISIENKQEEPKAKKPKVWIIYKHTCAVSGKYYIGMTCETIQSRWGRHWRDAHKPNCGYYNCHFYNAIRKYETDECREFNTRFGSKIWLHEIIEENILSKQDACDAEIKWIAELKANNGDFGYNSTKGGDCGPDQTPEHKAKLIAANKSRTGRKASEESRKKMSLARKGKKISPESIAKRKVTVSSDEYKEKIRLRGPREISPETSKKLSIAASKPKSEHMKKKLSETRKAMYENSEELREKWLEGCAKGRATQALTPTSEETKNKIKATLAQPEVKQKMIDAAKNRPPVKEETKEKMREAQKKRPPASEESKLKRKATMASPEGQAKLRARKKGVVGRNKKKNEQTQPLTPTPDILITK